MQHLIDAIRKANVNKYPNGELNNKLVFAVRGAYADANIGDVLQASYEWADNMQTDNKLSGTCACKIVDANNLDDYEDAELAELIQAAAANAKSYGDKVFLVFGIDTGECVNDTWANEVVIDDCTVLVFL